MLSNSEKGVASHSISALSCSFVCFQNVFEKYSLIATYLITFTH